MARDLVGMKFGRLTVIAKMPDHIQPNGRKRAIWLCKCECGNEVQCSGEHLTDGHTQSCGCLQKDISSKNGKRTIGNAINACKIHGGRYSRLYYVWRSMKTRCYNPHRSNYKYYGGRGIKVCDEWKNDFSAFREWAMTHGYNEKAPKGDCTIDRIDPNGNYCPDNCRFVDMFVQNRNKCRHKKEALE